MAPLRLLPTRRWLRSDSGAELIEMAFALPLLLLIITGLFDFGLMFREWQVATNAAREGARAGVLPEYAADSNVIGRVQQYMDASGFDVVCGPDSSGGCAVLSPVVDLTSPSGTFSARDVRVTVFHNFTFLVPFAQWFGQSFDSIALTGRAVMRTEVPVSE